MRKGIIIVLIVAGLFIETRAQKGEKSLAAGLFVSFPGRDFYNFDYTWNTGAGVEAIGQFNFTNKSAVLLRLQLTRHTGKLLNGSSTDTKAAVYISAQGGYRHQFGTSGFYANILAGIERGDAGFHAPATLGAGKRFLINDAHFVDAGLEYTGSFLSRYNVKIIYGLFRSAKGQ